MGQRAEKSWCKGPERSELAWEGQGPGQRAGTHQIRWGRRALCSWRTLYISLWVKWGPLGVVTTMTRSDSCSTKISLAAMVRLG